MESAPYKSMAIGIAIILGILLQDTTSFAPRRYSSDSIVRQVVGHTASSVSVKLEEVVMCWPAI